MCEKAKPSKLSGLIWIKCGVLLRLGGIMYRLLISSHAIRIKGREPNLCHFVNKDSNNNKRKKKLLPWLAFRHLRTDFFQTCLDDR